MVPSGSSTPIGGPQSANPSLLRSNSGMLVGSQTGLIPTQPPFSSLVSPRTQFNGNSLLGNMANVSPLNNSFGNGGPLGGISASNLQQRGGLGGVADMMSSAEANPLLFTSSSVQAQGQQQCFQNPSSNQLGQDQASQMDTVQNLQHQFSVPQGQQQQQQLRGGVTGMGHMGTVKLEPQMGPNDQIGPSQQLQNLGSMGVVKMDSQQFHSLRSLGSVKLENHHSDPSSILQQQQHQQQQQQQHQQILQLSRQNPQAAAAQMSLLQQQRIMQLQQQQQQQQQQIVKTLPQQRSQLQQQLLQQNLGVRSPLKPTMYEPGMCSRRLTQYMYNQQRRPQDNNIDFWRKFIAEYFAPNAKKRWCVSLYGNGRQTTGVFPQDVWHCEICNHKPGRGFETTVEVLPRLFQIKYASGTLEELLYIDMPREYQNGSGQIVLDYAKAIQESVFEQLRVVRDGQLRIVFNPDLKISSWEFCARRHEELIPRRIIIPQVSQLGGVVQRYQAAAHNASSGFSTQDLQTTCSAFVASARQLAKALEVPLVNDLGYTKRYVRCLQISEVVNSMKDLIDYSKETGAGPIDCLMNFPRRNPGTSGLQAQRSQLSEQQQPMAQNANHNDQNLAHATTSQLSAGSNGVVSANNSLNAISSTASAASVMGLLHQNSMNGRQENPMGTVSSPYGGGNAVQIPSASSSNSLASTQPNPPSPFSSLTNASNNIPTATSHNATTLMSSANSSASLSTMQQPTIAQLHETDPTDSQSTVQQILQELMMSSQLNGIGALGNDIKTINGVTPALNGGSCIVGNGMPNNTTLSGTNFAGVAGIGPAGGMRATMTNNAMAMNGRVGMNQLSQDPSAMNHQQQDIGSRLLDRLGAVNSFNNLQFDWKSFP